MSCAFVGERPVGAVRVLGVGGGDGERLGTVGRDVVRAGVVGVLTAVSEPCGDTSGEIYARWMGGGSEYWDALGW